MAKEALEGVASGEVSRRRNCSKFVAGSLVIKIQFNPDFYSAIHSFVACCCIGLCVDGSNTAALLFAGNSWRPCC